VNGIATRSVREQLLAELRARAFTPRAAGPPRVGVELELIPVDEATGRRRPLDGPAPATLSWLRPLAARRGWTERATPKGAPCFQLGRNGAISFEPGGQIEISTRPWGSASVLLARLRAVTSALRAAAARHGVALLASGVDPFNRLEDAPLVVRSARYLRMDRYLAVRGPAGPRMMRQTAAFQVNLDLGERPLERWRVLNRLAPWVIAVFANSPRYAGTATGERSYRAGLWRTLDPARTGWFLTPDADERAYLDFALTAPFLFREDTGGRSLPFADWLERGDVGPAEFAAHLGTLFPEVRPRGYLEVRSADAVEAEWWPALLALLGGIAHHPPALGAAREVLADLDDELLARAGRAGLAEPVIAAAARDLVRIALHGCHALGDAFLAAPDLDAARDILEQRTLRGIDPGSAAG